MSPNEDFRRIKNALLTVERHKNTTDFIQPTVQVQPSGLYRLTEDYRCESTTPSPGYTFSPAWRITLPVGFEWDGASVPRWVVSLSGVRRGGRYLGPSAFHDAFYRNGGLLPEGWKQYRTSAGDWISSGAKWTRHEVDLLFRCHMKEAGISWFQYHWAYRGVRIFGWFVWRAT